MAAGQYVIQDEDADYPDWIELHNVSASAVEMGGWSLTDNAAEPAKWKLPAVTLPPNGYLIVFADGKNRSAVGGRLHTNFSLSGNGEYLALAEPSGAIAFKFDPYPLQMPDVSFSSDGQFLGNPTPGAANDPTRVAIAAAPTFSEPHGLKSRPFALTLTTATAGGQIRYTIDGAEPTETVGALYTGPFPVRKTTVIRAVAFTNSVKASPIVTRTYIFPADVATQAADGKAPPRWPAKWTPNKTDYGMDPRITGVAPYRSQLQRGLATLPSISIVLPVGEFLDSERGIYNHPQEHGKQWERAASIELMNPDGTPGFQKNAGLRIRGGASRDTSNPKHSLRIFFRRSYGESKLEYPMFGPDGAASSDKFDLRCDQISSWHWAGDKKDDFIRDQWGRDSQIAMSQPGDRGDFYHLYINGLYWGLYNTQERHDAAFAANYFGGNEDEYDVVKYDNTFGGTNETDGTIASWRRLHDAARAGFAGAAAYQRVQGNNPDGTRNPAYERLVDVDNLIDYMLLGIYAAANDSPPSGGTQNNWGAIKSRKGDFGFRFFVHDWELAMYDARTDDFVGEQPVDNPLTDLDYTNSNGWHIWQALRFNADFRMRVADRVQRHFFGDGALTPVKAAARFRARMAEINFAVVGESARWGDAYFTNNDGNGGPIGPFLTINPRLNDAAANELDLGIIGGGGGNRRPLTRQDWLNATQVAFLQNYFPQRTGVVLQQLKNGGLYPAINPPTMTPGSGNISLEQLVTLANPNATGAIYFTLDGTDPRALGGALASGARLYAQPVAPGPLKRIKARVKDGESWSALIEAGYENTQDFSKLRITEISYNNPAVGTVAGDEYDFIELKNDGAAALDLSGLLFDQGVTFAFPAGTRLASGAFFLLGKNAARFAEAHPGKTLDGVFTGKLSDNGEDLTLSAGSGVPLIALHYRPDEGWPAAANGLGFTIVRADKGSPDNPANWRASTNPGGSPGADDPAPTAFPRVVIHSVNPNPATGTDTVVLKNVGKTPADISGWWVTDDPATPKKFRILSGDIIAAGDTRTIATATLDFARTGGAVWLFSANAVGDLTGYTHGFNYGAVETDFVLNRVVNSAGDERFVLNSGTVPNPRINEIHFHPAIGGDEFVELRSTASTALALDGWRLAGLSFTFPAGASIPANGFALVVTLDPATFRTKYNVPEGVPIYGPATGNLQDDGEEVALQKPITFAGVAGTFFETWESVRYNDKAPWPNEANGYGASLQRPRFANFSDDPANWLAAAPTPGLANAVNAAPTVTLISPADGSRITPPNVIAYRVNTSDEDGTIAKVEFLSDSKVVGTATAAPFAFDWGGADAGRHDLTARATDDSGNVTETDPITVSVNAPEPGAGRGLLAEYFPNRDLSGTPLSRMDPAIDFQWSDIDPAPGISRTGFSVRWTGKFVPRKSGDTLLNIHTAGGVRVYVDGDLLIDQWDNETEGDFPGGGIIFERIIPGTPAGTFPAIAGRPVNLRVEYRDGDGYANVRLSFSEPNQFTQQVIPTDLLYTPSQNPAAFAITTATALPNAQVGDAYQIQFGSVRGLKPIIFREETNGVIPPSGFTAGRPPGMIFSSTGLLSGTPTQAGAYAIFAAATDASGTSTLVEAFRIRVLPAGAKTQPVLTVTSPVNRSTLVGDLVQLTGTATSDRGIDRVEYSLTDNPWRAVTLTSPEPTAAAFSTTLNPVRGYIAGRNRLLVRAIDSDGTVSRVAAITLLVRQFAPLSVSVSGNGTVTAGFLGSTRREIGKSFTITATPGTGQFFTGWETDGFIATTDRTYIFSMFRGLNLKAVFIPNPFPALVGQYVAAIGTAENANDLRGDLACRFGRNGSFSARLNFAGKNYRFAGRVDPNGNFFKSLEGGIIVFDRGGFFESLNANLNVNFATGVAVLRLERFTNEQSSSVETTLQRSSWSSALGRPCPVVGRWDVTVQPPATSNPPRNPQPITAGTARLDIDANGRATLNGTLADGTPWTTVTPVDDHLTVPIYDAIYNDAGSISGELHFTSGGTPSGTGDFFWSRPADPTSAVFPLGFDVRVNVDAARHIEK